MGVENSEFAIERNRLWDIGRETQRGKLPFIITPDRDLVHHVLEDTYDQEKIHFGLAALLGKQVND